ncbi:MAG: HAD family hydrolase [Marinobacterium sp.]|nr:HAD family hydrolase [Marinobacterium sp.]
MSYDRFITSFAACRQQLEQWSQRHYKEYSIAELVDQFCDQYLPGSSPRLRSLFLEQYIQDWSCSVHHPLEITAMLHRLHEHYGLSVLSNCQHHSLAIAHLERSGLTPLLDNVLTSVEYGYRKPHPDIYAAAQQQAGCNASECLFIGDNLVSDYLGPRKAGMQSWLIDPQEKHTVPVEHRIKSILTTETRLLKLRMLASA